MSDNINSGAGGSSAQRRRPGMMTAAMQAVQTEPSGPKALRLDLIQDRRIVEERILRQRETVYVGPSERNHFIIQAPEIAARYPLFEVVGRNYVLNFTESMQGRVALAGHVQELQQLRQSGEARRVGDHWQVPLSESARGKVSLGKVTLLFQFVTPPPPPPKPQLPAAARSGFVKGIDWDFTAYVVFAYMFFFGVIIYLENYDYPIRHELEEVPEAVAGLIFTEPEAPTPVPEAGDETAVEDEGDTTVEASEESKRPAAAAEAGGESSDAGTMTAENRARMAQEAASQAEAMILGALGNSGAFADVLAGGAVTGDAESVLAQAAGVGVAQRGSGGALRTRSGGGSGVAGGLGGLRAAGGRGATQARGEGDGPRERMVRGTTRFESGGDTGGAGDFDASKVEAMIRKRRAAFQRCYENELRKDPALSGKVTVAFTIQESGSVSGARATSNTSGNAALAACVVGTFRRFRFNPGPEGGSVNYSYPIVFAPQK